MSFKDKVLEYKKLFESQAALVTQTSEYFLKNYVRSKIGSKESFNGTFIPGKIYAFRYQQGESKKVYNALPFVLCTDKIKAGEKRFLPGIDLGMTPPDKRLEILAATYDNFKENIENNRQGLKRGSVQSPLALTYANMEKIFR